MLLHDVSPRTFSIPQRKVRAAVEQFLGVAKQHTVEAIVLPELSVPDSCIGLLQAWSSETGGTVVGGSHYHKSAQGYISRCPVIVRGDVVFTEKIIPAPIEVSPVPDQSLIEGQSVVAFSGTPIGNFGVLICSDY
jgi:predicted amidohydrolase